MDERKKVEIEGFNEASIQAAWDVAAMKMVEDEGIPFEEAREIIRKAVLKGLIEGDYKVTEVKGN